MRRSAVLLAIVLILGTWAPVGGAAERGRIIDEEFECLEPVPAAVDAGPTPLGSARSDLDVLVLLDGVSHADGVRAVRHAAGAYRPVGVDLRARFQRVRVPADGRNRDYAGRVWFTASADRAMEVAKKTVGWRRPAGIDVVYLLTAKDLYVGGDEHDESRREYAIAGMADCIGGIRFPFRAFAVGEAHETPPYDVPVAIGRSIPGKILAHEIGHLLGAHHHAANCGEAVPAAVLERSTDLCTLMFNDIGLVSLRFSTPNRVVVRGHARAYGRAT